MNKHETLIAISKVLDHVPYFPGENDALEENLLQQIRDLVGQPQPKRLTKNQIVNFAANRSDLTAYNDTEVLANDWLEVNPDAEILHMSSALAADFEWSEHCLTIAVRVPLEHK